MLAACEPSPPPVHPHVEVRELDDDHWQATWRFTEPVRGMRFERPAGHFREHGWQVATPGYALVRDGAAQVVVANDGVEPVDRLVIEFPVDTATRPREYESFHRFTDGSIAVYTGHFHVVPLGSAEPVRDVVVVPGSGRPPLSGTADAGRRGSYVYVGDIAPLRTREMTAVLDPALPDWVADGVRTHLPRFLGLLAARTGHELDARPLVLFSFVPDAATRGYASGGGALRGLLQLSARGDAWHDANPWAERHLLRFIAHEAVHLWNGGITVNRPGSPAWMHEGAADAMAERLLYDTGIIDTDALQAYAVAARDRCVGAGANGRPAEYACGRVVAAWTGHALRKAGSSVDLFGFWGALITRARAADGHYDEDDYFAVLAGLGVAPAVIADMRAFVDDPRAEHVRFPVDEEG